MSESVTGNLHVANDALADMVAHAAMECYGVVGMTSADDRGGRAKVLPEAKQKRGVTVRDTEAGVRVDVYVVIEYGTNISTVSHNLIDSVSFVLTDFAHVPLAGVEVHVQDIRVKR